MSLPPPTPELSPLQRAFLALERAEARAAAAEAEAAAAAREPIAVIGLACRVPGAPDAEAFWQLLRRGVDAIGPVPAGRFDLDALHDPSGERPGHSLTREAGFLPDVAGFDPEFFGITRREAHGMDPQQRLLLEVSWQALEHAAQPPDRLSHSPTGVYFGVCSTDYSNLILKQGDPALLDAHYTSGIAHSVASGRVSYLLGLQGPAVTVDTACSSSLVAVHLACQALRARDCRMALAGGVNVMLSPDLFVAFSNTRMLARDGRCKTFDAAADGFGRGEGCGVVVLKRLSDAQADGDRVLAVIRGSAVNQDGPSSGLTAPNGPAQEAVIREALSRAGVAPCQVGLIEAHGTGTELGDPLEVQALGHVFGPGRDPAQPLWLGSVKTNVGHLEAAAGVTGLIKLVLALRHREVPPHLHWRRPSPHIAWDALPVRVPVQASAWAPIDGRRIAGVSSFGFSGTNAHIVVEEAPEAPSGSSASPSAGRLHLFMLSARDERALSTLAGQCVQAFAPAGDAELPALCRTAAVGRARLPERAAVLAPSMGVLREALQALADGRPHPALSTARVARRDPPRVAFLFTGQGAQYVGMARDLDAAEPVFRAALERCAAVLDPLLGQPLRELLFAADGSPDRLDATAVTQPALFAVEYALATLWQAWGVQPDALIGHSVGEIAAACVAGAMSLDDALRLVVGRGRLMQSLPAGGAMAALQASEDEVAALLPGAPARVGIAAVNGPRQVVVAGPADEVDRLVAAWSARGGRGQRLAVSHAFHSPLVDPILDDFERLAAGIAWQRPRLRLVSNVTGDWARPEDVSRPAYWRRHVREPVRFAQGLQTLSGLAPDVLIEVGPQPTLLALVPPGEGDAPRRVPSLRRGRADADQMSDALASLFLAGVDVDWRAVWAASPVPLADLPGYPFQRERCWFDVPVVSAAAPAGPATSATRATGHPLLGVRLRSAVPGLVVFDTELDSARLPWLGDHRVAGRPILPATGFIELLLAAGRAAGSVAPAGTGRLAGLLIGEPLAVADGETRAVQVLARPQTGGAVDLEVLSLDAARDTWIRHAQARWDALAAPAEAPALAALRADCGQDMDVAAHRAALAARGLDFGPSLQGLVALRRGEPGADQGRALGEVLLPEAARPGAYLLHPALLDACLQVMAAALPEGPAGQAAYLPLAFDEITWLRTPGRRVWAHAQVCQAGGGTLSAQVLVLDEAGPVAWLDGITLRAATPSALGAPDVLWRVDWQADPGPGLQAAWLPAPARWAARLDGRLEMLADAEGLAAHHDAGQVLERLGAAWIVRALQALGWQPAPGEAVEAEVLAGKLGVLPRYRRLLARYLDILAEDGMLVSRPGGWSVVRIATPEDPAAAAAALAEHHPASRVRTELAAVCGPALPAVLRGQADPLHLLFPPGDPGRTEALYRDTPEARVYNPFLRDAVLAALADRPPGRPLRILEVGGGTGGTTAWLAPALPAEGTDYLFTDIGPSLVARARERFGPAHGFMRFATLDLEQDLAAQGLDGACFDLIVAANVIHATADLRRTLAALRGVLTPGGQLLMLEVTASERWIDLSFALTEGWWRFTDTALRRGHPLLSRGDWLALLADCGFEAAALDPADPRSHQAVLAARRPLAEAATERGRWLVVPDAGGLAEAWAALAPEGVTCAPRALDADALAAWLAGQTAEGAGAVRGVLYLAGLDAAPFRLDETDAAAAAGTPERVLGPLLGVVQALGRLDTGAGAAPRLWVVSVGAHPVDAELPLSMAQAPLAGLCRALEREHPEWRTTWIDLDPADGVPAQARALDELLSRDDAERQVAWRRARRYVARLAPLPATGSDDPGEVRLEAGGTGVIDDLRLVAAARRRPGPGQVEIRMLAAGVNFRDVMNVVAMRADPEPLGGECAGRVVAVGEGVAGLAPGDDVVAIAEACFADHVLADAADVVRLPRGIGHAQAATVPFAFMTAWHALHDLAQLQAGQTVLIHAAAGGVGSAAVQLARRAGATVIATAGSPAKQAHLRALGVCHVLNSRTLDFSAEVLALTQGRGVDVVLNSLAGEPIAASVACLAAQGSFLEIGKRDIWDAARFHRERPRARYHAIDLAAMRHADPAAARALFARVMDSLRRGDIQPLPLQRFALGEAAQAMRWMAQARHVGKVVLVTEPGERARATDLDPAGSYLVTGGLGGLGLLTAGHLVDHGARHLLLVGRRAPDEATQARLAQWRAAGVQVETLQADVADPQAVARVFEHLDARLPVLRGVVHSAGQLADGALVQQDWARFAPPLGPKVAGAWALHVHTRQRPLDFFVLYSSVAGTLGSAGQTNHAAANAFLDALAAHRRALGLPGLSLAWGAWSGVGAAAERQVDQQVGRRGIGTLAPAQGLAWLDALLPSAWPQVVVFPVDWARLLASEGGVVPAFLERMRPAALSAPPLPAALPQAPAAASDGWAEQVLGAAPARRTEVLQAFVAEQVARVIQAPDARAIDLRQPLNELGLDSLMAVDLRNRLAAGLGLARNLPATLVFDHPTIEALAAFLLERVAPAPAAAAPAEVATPLAAPAVQGGPRVDTVGAIDEMSDEEVEAMFARRMRRS